LGCEAADGEDGGVEEAVAGGGGGRVDEVAAVAVGAEAVLQEPAAHLGLVLAVGLVVLLELLQPMGELAPLLVGAVAVFHKLFAQLRLLLVRGLRQVFSGRFLGGEGVAEGLVGLEEGRHCGGEGGDLAHAFFLG
jgi:hypothetical protein